MAKTQMVHTRADLAQQIALWRAQGDTIAFVPTMGNLHAGHLALVESAKTQGTRVIVSIFVNPLQFGPNEDFDRYPRTLTQDSEKLCQQNICDLIFAPSVDQMYPDGASQTRVCPPDWLNNILCGAHRPGHFDGVATVVLKLFQLVRADVALFGSKDYQQVAVLRQMARDLALHTEIIACPTVREADGLAMSSRNQYLDAAARQTAPVLFQTLMAQQHLLQNFTQTKIFGNDDFIDFCEYLSHIAKKTLTNHGFDVDYYEIRHANLKNLRDNTEIVPNSLVILVAARLGKTRLIDNICFDV